MTETEEAGRSTTLARPTSLVEYAAAAIRRKILTGELMPGERIREQRITDELGISRPPLREAFRRLEQEGLVHQQPRRGTSVTPLTLHDVYEIFTLRREYERLAVRMGIPVTVPARLERVRNAFAVMDAAARAGDETAHAEGAFGFHLSVIGLSGHGRLEAAYRSLQLQMQLCMAMNRAARADEDMIQDVARHRRLVDVIEAGDPEAVIDELVHHGDRTFLDDIENRLDGHSDAALQWLDEVRKERQR